MQYRSTRSDESSAVDSATAVLQGLAPDGGLYVPLHFPKPSYNLDQLNQLKYADLAQTVLSWFFDDYSDEQLKQCVESAYGAQFDDKLIVPISKQHAGSYYMELFHGPTLAFKDLALQILPHLMKTAAEIKQDNQNIVILTATSGDTGTASMRGFSNVEKTNVIVFYPNGGVSPVQLRQMLSQPGDNLEAIAINGNFDEAQTEVKHIFNDQSFNQRLHAAGFQFSSANSMNIGRLIPQVAYYFYTYGQMVQRGDIQSGDQVNFVVPTGNFGDILAGYYAKKLGLPINKLVCASNQNNVLTDFFNTGIYNKKRAFHLTNSPSMDILVSSNLERLLFDVSGEDPDLISHLMEELNQDGQYQITEKMRAGLADFVAGFASESQIAAEIKRVYEDSHYAMDPHTAVASSVAHDHHQELSDQLPTVVVSTASPYKFPETVYQAITGDAVSEKGLPAIKQLNALLGDELSAGVKELFELTPKDEQIIDADEMQKLIQSKLQ